MQPCGSAQAAAASPACLLNLGENRTPPREEHSSRPKPASKYEERKNKNKEIVSRFVCFSSHATVNKLQGFISSSCF